jgi:hypothetical protein
VHGTRAPCASASAVVAESCACLRLRNREPGSGNTAGGPGPDCRRDLGCRCPDRSRGIRPNLLSHRTPRRPAETAAGCTRLHAALAPGLRSCPTPPRAGRKSRIRRSAPALHQRPSPRPASYVLLPSSAGPVPRTQGPTPRFGLVNPRRLKLPVDLFNDLIRGFRAAGSDS